MPQAGPPNPTIPQVLPPKVGAPEPVDYSQGRFANTYISEPLENSFVAHDYKQKAKSGLLFGRIILYLGYLTFVVPTALVLYILTKPGTLLNA
mmetsp:Transcript_15766/g.24271  ORF Transcript_15766/g.24271 Transcript_15766/m.24271 type:complete len:93 (-) Transcript_15766:343-621(-)